MCFASESTPHGRHGASRSDVDHAVGGRRAGWRSVAAAALVAAACLTAAGCGGGGYANNNGGGGSGSTPTPTPTPTPTTAPVLTSVHGTLADAYNNDTGIANATITLDGQSVVTDNQGHFTFTFNGAQAAGTLTVTGPPGSNLFSSLVLPSSCSATLSLQIPALEAGANDAIGTIVVYNLVNQNQQPPPAPCISST